MKCSLLCHRLLVILAMIIIFSTYAQADPMGDTLRIGYVNRAVKGTIKGEVTNFEGAPLGGVIVRAIHLPDSVVRGGAATDTLGVYQIEELPLGKYILLCEAVGYSKGFMRFEVTEDLPLITARPVRIDLTDLTLGEAVVVGKAPLVTVTDDTVAYNASAMVTEEGAMAEALIEQIPGAEITEDGKIKINGKEYSKILIDGKEFFGNDPSATLKNLPANIIRRIKTYDRRSDRARLTGIDDGEEHNVIDIEIKKDMFKGMVGNVGLSMGSDNRYAERFNVNRFRSNQHMGFVSNINNVNNPAFSERGNGASNSSTNARTGLTSSKSVGFTYAKEKRKKYKVSGNVRYGFSDADNWSERHTETHYTGGSEYYNDNKSSSARKRHELNAEFEWEWRPDTLTTFQIRPNVSYNTTDNWSQSRGNSSNWAGTEGADTIPLNRHSTINDNNSDAVNTNASMVLFRRLSAKGRNISLNASYGYSHNNSENMIRTISLYNRANRQGLNKNYDRYYDGNTNNFHYTLGFNYTEPIFNKSYLSLRYNYTNSHSKTNRHGYELDHPFEYDSLAFTNMEWANVPIDTTLSNITENTYQSHSINLSMRHVTEKMNLNYGVHFNPRHNEANFILGQKMDKGLVKQDLLNWSPTLHFKYKFTKRNSLDLNYSGNSSEPNIEQLQTLIDKTNPQVIRYGNPNLKPSFTHNVRANFNMYGEKSHRSLVTNWNYSTTTNSVSTMSFTESSTGFRVSKLMNVDGQWNMNGNINFNTPLDSMQHWNVSTTTWASYNSSMNFNSTPLTAAKIRELTNKSGLGVLFKNNASVSLEEVPYEYIEYFRDAARVNHTRNFRINQGLSIRYTSKPFSWRLGGNVSYYKVSNTVKNGLTRETFDYTVHTNMQAELPLNSQVSTNLNFVSRHGYSSSVQKNVCIWNAQLTKRLFKNNEGNLSFQIFDILHQRNNITRTINALSITDTKQLMLKDYFLVSFQYNFNTLRNRGRNHMNRNGQGNNRWNNGNRNGQGNNNNHSGNNNGGNRSFGGGGGRF